MTGHGLPERTNQREEDAKSYDETALEMSIPNSMLNRLRRGFSVLEVAMKNPLIVGVTAGAAISTWSLMTMLLPVSYRTWDIGRSVLFVAFAVALVRLGASRSRASAMSTFGAVAVACLVAAGLTLVSYAVSTGFFAPWIVQLPEYLNDYTYHGYTSPQLYLSTNYTALLGLQLFSWGITAIGLLLITGTTGLYLGRYWWRAQAA
jgi:hypothetical protein